MTPAAKKARDEYMRKWREANRERINAYYREWRKKNREKVKRYQERYWLKKAQEEFLDWASGGSK